VPQQPTKVPSVPKRAAPRTESREELLAQQLFVKLYPVNGKTIAHLADMAMDAAEAFFKRVDERRG